MKRSGQIVDIVNRRIFPGTVLVEEGKIAKIIHNTSVQETHYILPGFVDAHVHIESSMLIPSEFARLATTHGTVGVVTDPHEIGNVLGKEGVRYMIENGKRVPFHFAFGVPSCVPATSFETSGATLSSKEVEELFLEEGLLYLSEMMNYPGVLANDKEVIKKIAIAHKLHKKVDGHAPGLKGDEAKRYAMHGISTDHECFTLEEALDKIAFGMKILIREGSAAKNYDALHPLIKEYPDKVMFCSDDKHPHELVLSHIDALVKRSMLHGYDLMDVLRIASLNPIRHYGLPIGLLQEGDSADFIVAEDLVTWKILETVIKGVSVAKEGKPLIPHLKESAPNQFNAKETSPSAFLLPATGAKIRVIQAEDGQLITTSQILPSKIVKGFHQVDQERDLLKIALLNRYMDQKPALAFIQNFGLKRGAIASTVAHDSHNLIAVGTSDEAIARAINLLIRVKGGISLVDGNEEYVLPLPVAGIMSLEEGYKVAKLYEEIDQKAKKLGSKLSAPFMTLSFMALLVIPELKLSDKGLFDGKKFSFTPLEYT